MSVNMERRLGRLEVAEGANERQHMADFASSFPSSSRRKPG
jgi:hypothetical protein